MTLAALSGFVAIAMGAFAAHGISDPQAKAEWDASQKLRQDPRTGIYYPEA